MKRWKKFSNRHPLLSIVLGYLVVVAIALVLLPDDSVQMVVHERVT
jgi:hypothetical protein